MAGLCALSLVLVLASAPQGAGPVFVVPGQDETQQIVLLDGTHALGRVETISEDALTFRTTAGAVLQVERAQVASLGVVAGRVVRGTFWPADPNTTRLLFGPTARALKRGDSYLAVYQVSLPFVQVGLTDRISVGAGTLPYFGGGTSHPFWVTPKVQLFAGTKTAVAVGALHFANIGDDNLGIGYGVLTHGTADSAVTVGLGYGYVAGEDGGGAPMIMVGGEHRVARRDQADHRELRLPERWPAERRCAPARRTDVGRLRAGVATGRGQLHRVSNRQLRLDVLTERPPATGVPPAPSLGRVTTGGVSE